MHVRLLTCLTLATCGTGCAALTESPQSTSLQSGIVGGQAENGYPAVGAIMNDSGLCTATVFNGSWAVTASHCFMEGASGFQFYFGSDVNAPTRTIAVAEVFTHPGFDKVNLTNDIAVIRLAEDPGVVAIPLVDALDNNVVGENFKFVGYGITSGGGQDSGTKRSVVIPIQTLEAQSFTYATPGRNTCNGDSGGPALVRRNNVEYIAGVTSWGDENCQQMGSNTRVDVFKDFIQQAMAGQIQGQPGDAANPGGDPGQVPPGGAGANPNPGAQPGNDPAAQPGNDPAAQPGNDPGVQPGGEQGDCADADGDGWCDDPAGGAGAGAGDGADQCADADGDGWCDDPAGGAGAGAGNGGDQCADADGDGWCDDPAGDGGAGDCADADFDGFCDDGSDGGGAGDCADADGDGWCDDGSDGAGADDGWGDCVDADGDGWCD